MSSGERRSRGRVMVDTSVLILHLRGRPEGKALMQWAATGGTPYVSAVSMLGLAQGMRPSETAATYELLQNLETVDITADIARRAGLLIGKLRHQGVTIHFSDGLIAASTLSVGAILLTHNVRHFEAIPELEVLDARAAI